MRKLYTLLTTVSLFSTVVCAANSVTDSDDFKIKEIMDGRRINCSSYEPSLTPTLNFETVGPKATVNATSTQVSLQMKVIYYRCNKGTDSETTFAVVDPKSPYQYDVEQFDGTTSTVKVNSQQYRFSSIPGTSYSTDVKKGLPARIEIDGLIHNVRFDIPLEKLLSSPQRATLKSGGEVSLSIKVISALSTDYKIGAQTRGDTGFIPGTSLIWELKLSMDKKALKAELLKIRTTML
jgi:hypothetical protein